jgi:hypothetical protein
MLSEHDLKNILMDCKCQSPYNLVDPSGLYVNNLDINEFGRKVEEKVALAYARKERELCIEFVHSINPLVALALTEKRGGM